MNEEERKIVNRHLEQVQVSGPIKHGPNREISANLRASYSEASTNQTFHEPDSTRGRHCEKSSSGFVVGKNFQPQGTVEFPLKFKDGSLITQPNVRGSVSCNISSGRWNSKLIGSSLVRGPVGAGDGSILLSYDVQPNKLQAVSQLEIGDQAHVMAGSICHTPTAWYGIGLLFYPHKTVAFQLQSEQRSNLGQVTLKLKCPADKFQPNASITFQSKLDTITPICLEVGLKKSLRKVDLSLIQNISKNRNLMISSSWRSTGFQCDVDLRQRHDDNTSVLGVGVRHHGRQGLSWIFTWVRGNMKIKVPVFILKSGDPSQFVCSLYLAFVSFLVQEAIDDVWELTPRPTDNKDVQESSTHLYLEYSVTKAKLNAEKQVMLMKKQAALRRKIEIEKKGLVINRAIYYIVGGDTWDVTIQLQFWTIKSSLDLPALPKQNLLGFYDVAASISDNSDKEPTKRWRLFNFLSPEQESQTKDRTPILTVQYDYAGVSYEIRILNNEPLSLPSDNGRVVLPTSSENFN